MARITVEDCIDKFPSRFELVLVASQRARKLHSGDTPIVEKDNDKNTVIALREIADSSMSVEEMKENLILEYQTVTMSDEEDENLELESSLNNINSENSIETSKEVEEELDHLVKSEDSEIQQQYEISDSFNDIVNEESDTSNQELDVSNVQRDDAIEELDTSNDERDDASEEDADTKNKVDI